MSELVALPLQHEEHQGGMGGRGGGEVPEQWHSTWIMLLHKSAVISKLSITRESLMRSPLCSLSVFAPSLIFTSFISVSLHLIDGCFVFVFSSRPRGLSVFVCAATSEQSRLKPTCGGKGLEARSHRSSLVLPSRLCFQLQRSARKRR